MTPALKKLLELETLQLAQGQAPGTAVSNGEVQTRTIMAQPDREPVPAPVAPVAPKADLELGDVTDEEKARTAAIAGGMKPETYDAMVEREQNAQAKETVGLEALKMADEKEEKAKKLRGESRVEAEAEAARLRSWALLVRSGDKVTAAFTGKPLDETRYNYLMGEGDRKIANAKEIDDKEFKLELTGQKKPSITQTLAQKESDPNSAESKSFRRYFQSTNYGKTIDPEVLNGMSKKDMMGAIQQAGSDFNYVKGARELDVNSPAAQGARALLKGNLAKWAPKGVDFDALTAAELDKYVKDAQDQRDREGQRGWESFQKNADRAFQKSMEEMRQGTKEAQDVGKEMANIAMGEYLVEKAKRLVNNEKVPEGGVLYRMVNQVADKNEYLQTMLNSARSEEEKELLRTLAALNEAAAKASGGVVTDSDRKSAQLLNGLPPGAPKADILKALDSAQQKFEVKKEAVKATYPNGWQIYQKRIQGESEAAKKSGGGQPKPAPQNSPSQKPTGKKVRITPLKGANAGKPKTYDLNVEADRKAYEAVKNRPDLVKIEEL